jgi:hypothetical protein
MFILRTVEDVPMLRPPGQEGGKLPIATNVKNLLIGDNYEVVTHTSSQFSGYLHKYELDADEVLDHVMFLTSSNLNRELILWKTETVSYYIMTESGKTFQKL